MLSLVPPVPPVYGGSVLVLNCTIQLSDAVDSGIVITPVWRKRRVVIEDSPQKRVSDAIQITNTNLYYSKLTFNPVLLNADDGPYMCEVSVESSADNPFILGSRSTSNNVTLSVQGM